MTKPNRNQTILIFTLAGLSIALSAYVFLVSFGTWATWPTSTNYYDQLASAFSRGQLSLLQSPSPDLLALPNPYDPNSRTGIPYPQDVSLYKGKFHLYFGPVPALLLMVVKAFGTGEVGDQYLVFGFAAGLLVVQSLFLARFLQKKLVDLPAWLALPSILGVGLTSPIGWMLSLASVYNASILGGQFFFFSGLYTAYRAFDRPIISRGLLALAGTFWVLGIGSRMTQTIPVGVLTAAVVWGILNKDRRASETFKTISTFLLPLCIGAVCLGWYNWARFDSVFEFGTTYQLAGPNLQLHRKELFSPQYIPNNFYNYFLIRPEVRGRFPFLGPVSGYNEAVIKSMELPGVYFSQETAGLLYIAPFLLFAIPAIPGIVIRAKRVFRPLARGFPAFDWLMASLLVAFLGSLVFFLLFFWAGVRYQAEFIPASTILAVFGFWEIYGRLPKQVYRRVAYVFLGLALTAITIVNSNLIALSIASSKYREFNPQLWAQWTKFFSQLLGG